MSVVLMLSTVPMALLTGRIKSNLMFYFVFVMIIAIITSLAKHKIIAIIPMSIQAVMTAYMLHLSQYTESKCLLYVATVSIIILISTSIEMMIEKKEAKKIT